MVEVSLLPRGRGLGEGNAIAASLQPPLSVLDRSDCGLGVKAGVPAHEGEAMGPGQPRLSIHPRTTGQSQAAWRSQIHTQDQVQRRESRAKKFCPPWEDMEGLKGENPRERKDQKPLSRTPVESFVHLPESGLCHICPERERF